MNKKAMMMLAASAAAFSVSLYSYALAAFYEPSGAVPEVQVSDSRTFASQSDQTFQTKVIRLWNDKAAVFEPGEEKEVQLVLIGGKRVGEGLSGLTNGSMDDEVIKKSAFEKAEKLGFKGV